MCLYPTPSADVQDEQVKELMEVPQQGGRGQGQRILHPKVNELKVKYQEQVKTWHEQHDRLNTFEGLIPHECNQRNGEPFYRWLRLKKVFPAGTGSKASRGPELEYKTANAEMYGDLIKLAVSGGKGRQEFIRGYIKYIETSTESKPHAGGRVYIYRPHRPIALEDTGEGPYHVEQIVYETRNETEKHLRMERDRLSKSYPHNLTLLRRTVDEEEREVDIPLGQDGLKLARDELDALTLVVDVMDGTLKRMPFETTETKIKLSNIYVQVAVFRDHSNPQMRQLVPFDDSPHVLIRYNTGSRNEGGRYVLMADLFDGWKVFDRPGRYVMQISLYYDMQDRNTSVRECGAGEHEQWA